MAVCAFLAKHQQKQWLKILEDHLKLVCDLYAGIEFVISIKGLESL